MLNPAQPQTVNRNHVPNPTLPANTPLAPQTANNTHKPSKEISTRYSATQFRNKHLVILARRISRSSFMVADFGPNIVDLIAKNLKTCLSELVQV